MSRWLGRALCLTVAAWAGACASNNGQKEDLESSARTILGLPIPLPGSPANPPGPSAIAGCGPLNDYTAAIAEAVIACTGTLGPDSLVVGNSGLLQRNFTTCRLASGPAASQLLQTIDDFLGLQQRASLPARSCFPDQWSSWRASFLGAGNTTCPSWSLVASLGAATVQTVALVAAQLPLLRGLPDAGLPLDILDLTKQNFLYLVTLPLLLPLQPCGNALSCAEACSGGLPGFFLGRQNGLALGDPRWWLSSASYDTSSDPFNQNGYYHPMSYYGDLPGDVYGHRNRVGESCSRWGGNYHYQAVLKLDCVSPGDPSSPCSSVCDVP